MKGMYGKEIVKKILKLYFKRNLNIEITTVVY